MKTASALKYIFTVFLLSFVTKIYAQIDACVVSPSADTAICKGAVVKLSGANCGTPIVPSSMADYYWTNLSNGNMYAGQDIFVMDSGRYELTVTDLNTMASDVATIHITYKTPTFNINNDASFVGKCSQSSITLNATTDVNFINYNWYKVGSAPSLDQDAVFLNDTITKANYYAATVYHTVTGCTLKDTIYVTIFPEPTPQLGNDTTVCNGQTVTLNADNGLTPGTYEYAWGSGSFGTANTYVISSAGKYKVRVKGPWPYPCIAADSINLSVTPVPVVNNMPPVIICYGNNILLTTLVSGASGPYTYTWSPNDGTLSNINSASPLANPIANTTYTVSVKVNATGCTGTSTRTVNVNPQITASVAFPDTTACPGATIQLQGNYSGGTGPYTMSWRGGSSNTNTLNISPTNAGQYWFKVKDTRSCEDSASVDVDMLWVQLGSTDTIALNGDVVTLNALNSSTAGFSFTWRDSTGAVIGSADHFDATTANKYTVEVSNGTCMVTDTKLVLFTNEIIEKVYVPNAFNPGRPEADNSNLRVYGNNISNVNFSFRVYNQWGELVYETNSFTEANDKGWNGMMKNTGNPLNMGVYTYTVRGQFYDGIKFDQAGTASLMR